MMIANKDFKVEIDSKRKKKISMAKLVSTILVEFVLFFSMVYTSPSMLRAPIIIVAFLWTIVRRGKKINLRNINYTHLFWAVSVFVLVVVSRLWAIEPQGIDDVAHNVLWAAMASIVIADYVIFYKLNSEDICKILIPIAFLFIINVVMFGAYDQNSRLSISGGNANGLGVSAAILMSFFTYSIIVKKNKKLLYIVLSIILLVFGLLSGSRKAIISIAIYLISYTLFGKYDTFLKKIGKLFLIVCVLLVSYMGIMSSAVLYSSIGNRMESVVGFSLNNEEADASVNTRLNMVSLATNIIKMHPLLGIGANNFKYATYYHTYSHNGYTEVACCFGVVGLIIYYLPILRMTLISFKNKRQRKKDALLPLTAFVAFFVCEIAQVSYFDITSYCYIGIISGLCYCISRNYGEDRAYGDKIDKRKKVELKNDEVHMD